MTDSIFAPKVDDTEDINVVVRLIREGFDFLPVQVRPNEEEVQDVAAEIVMTLRLRWFNLEAEPELPFGEWRNPQDSQDLPSGSSQ